MNNFLKKLFSFDRTTLTLLILVLSALIYIVTISLLARDLRSQNSSLTKQISEMQALSGEVLMLKSLVQSKEKKISISRASGVVSAIEQILSPLGIEASAIKPLEKKNTNGFTEENAELEIHDADLNSIVNFLFNIDNSPVPFIVKSAAIKSTFEDPDKFILNLSVALLSKS
jgi:cell division protein FtsL